MLVWKNDKRYSEMWLKYTVGIKKSRLKSVIDNYKLFPKYQILFFKQISYICINV